MKEAIVLEAGGRKLSPTSLDKARRLLAEGKARLVCEEPFTIQLTYTVEWSEPLPSGKKSLLLHICCGPCSTYTVNRLREEGFTVTGYWYNPNIHPWQEHERRRKSLAAFAEEVGLPMLWHERYEMPAFLRAVAGREKFGERCQICYHLRLSQTARLAQEKGFEAFSTTLLISPHQNQGMIRSIGEEVAAEQGVEFYFENFRRGWAERGHLTRQYNLYRQEYCGCIYSEWERYNKAYIDVLLD